MGPYLVASHLLDPDKFRLTTVIDGELRQDELDIGLVV